MSKTARLVLGSLSLLLVLAPLSIARFGMPMTLKADEPAYYLAALSLVRDGDAVCGPEDLRRLFDAYPHLPVENLILMSLDGWRTVYFGKPIIYSLAAAPLAAVLGSRGFVAFNMLMFAAMIWLAFSYLRRANSQGMAAFFGASFFLVSVAFAYVFWLHPEVLNMFSVMVCLYFAFTPERGVDSNPLSGPLAKLAGRLSTGAWRPVWSGAALALVVYNKPMFALIGLPALVLFWRRKGLKAGATWLAAAAVALAAQAGVSYLLTETPTPYLGTSRIGFKIENPDDLEGLLRPFERPVQTPQTNSSYGWLARVPRLFPRLLVENIGFFLVGRHTGLFVYMPFAAICLALFLLWERHDPVRWLTVASLAAIALFFLIWIHYNWHGGAGFIGNRYFVTVYPAFLFLVSRIRPPALSVLGFAAGGVFLAPILLTPFGVPVPEPTLQAHVRGAPFQILPQELSIGPLIPGYVNFNTRGLSVRGRKDQFAIADRANGAFWVRGADRVEIWISSPAPLREIRLAASSLAPRNRLALELGRERREVVFTAEAPRQVVTLTPKKATKVRYQYDKKLWAYRLMIETDTGRNPRGPDGQVLQPQFYVGAEIGFDRLERAAPAETAGG